MRHKLLSVVGITFIAVTLLMLGARPTAACDLLTSTINANCSTYTINVTGIEATADYGVSYTVTVTPSSGAPVTITGSIALVPDPNGVFNNSATHAWADYGVTLNGHECFSGQATITLFGYPETATTRPLTFSPVCIDCPSNCTGTIGDFVWEDLNHDGLQDFAEPGINGVTVTLTNASNTVLATAVTAAGPGGNGYYQFTGLCAGDYKVIATPPAGFAPTAPCHTDQSMPTDSNCSPALVNLPTSNSSNPTIDFGFVRGGCVTDVDCDDHEVCTTDTCVAGFCQNVLLPNTVCLCTTSPCPDLGHAGAITTTIDGNGDVTVVFAESIGINDNSYGANIVNWPRAHKFDDLVGSDKAQFVFKDTTGRIVFNFYLDYISKKTGPPSGYASLGATGGDGHVNVGQAAWLLNWQTSLAANLNDTGYCSGGHCTVSGVNLLADSPPTTPLHTGYTLPPAFSQWDFNIVYMVTISHLAFGASGFGGVTVPFVHNSPPKCGVNATDFGPCPCSGVIGDFVWNDLNQNGMQDPGEPGISGVALTLRNSNNAIVAQATSDSAGRYHFTGLCPGAYKVAVDANTLPPGFTPTVCSLDQTMPTDSNCSPAPVDLPSDGVSNQTIDFGYIAPPVPPCVTNADCDDHDPCTADTCVGGVCHNETPAGTTCVCAPSDCPGLVPAGSITTTIDGNGDVTIVFEESTGINDNSYGVNVVTWPRSHKFQDLVGSDKANFVLTDANGRVVFDFYLDYISQKTGTASGYGSLGVTGGEGRVNIGQAAWVLSWQTSLASNLNTTGYCTAGNCTVAGVNLLVDSPPTHPAHFGYVLPPAFSQWSFPIAYTVKVSHLAFGSAGFGGVTVPSVHNSPPKCGDNAANFAPCARVANGNGPVLSVVPTGPEN